MNHLKWALCLFPFSTLLASADSWYERKLEGWYYFQECNAEPALQTDLVPEAADEILEEEKQRLKEHLSLALLEPTEENVERYLREQKRWIDQSALFSQVWRSVYLSHPELSLTQEALP